jgi:hypothetical protein
MAEALRRAHPALAAQVRATDFARPVDIFRR